MIRQTACKKWIQLEITWGVDWLTSDIDLFLFAEVVSRWIRNGEWQLQSANHTVVSLCTSKTDNRENIFCTDQFLLSMREKFKDLRNE